MAISTLSNQRHFFFICSSILLSSSFAAAFEIEIRPPGERFVKPFNTNAVFSCHVTGTTETNIKIQWVGQEAKPIPENVGYRIYVEKGQDNVRKLYITSIAEQDAGKYTCFVTVGDKTKEKSVELFNFKDITFEHVPNPQHPKIHCDARIECKVTGNPTPVVSWRFNGNPVEGNRYVKEPNGLLIKNITQADDGNYTCRAEVEADGRFDKREITVIVHIPPTLIEGPGNIEGIEGRYFSMSCRSNGFPSPKFEFYKQDKQKEQRLLSTSEHIHFDGDFGKVEFRPLKKEDEGVYYCKALNDVGELTNDGSIRVFVPPKVNEFKNVTLVENENAVLSCKSAGDPPPTMTIRKIGNERPYHNGSNEGGHIIVMHRVHGLIELQIKRILPSDKGSYVCQANNLAGDHSATNSILVHYKPRFTKRQPHIEYSWAGRVHNITCEPEAEPMATIEWQRAERLLENNDTFNIFGSVNVSNLQIRVKEADQSWIYGDYICRARNLRGHTDFKIILNRATVPAAPQNVSVTENYPNLILLTVDPPRENGGVKLVGYRVEYGNRIQDFTIVDKDDKRKNQSQKLSDVVRIENLKPATEYVFHIRAKNEVGAGNFIEKVVTTANISKPFPVRLTSPKHGRESNQYQVTWEKPKTGGKPIRRYHIRYQKIHIDRGREVPADDWVVSPVNDKADSPMLSHMLTGLTPNTYYKLEVLAENDLGYSKPEGDFLFRTGSEYPLVGPASKTTHTIDHHHHLYWLPLLVLIYGASSLLWTVSVQA